MINVYIAATIVSLPIIGIGIMVSGLIWKRVDYKPYTYGLLLTLWGIIVIHWVYIAGLAMDAYREITGLI